MTTLHVLRGFIGPGGGNPHGVFLNGAAFKEERRQALALELGFAETVFVDDIQRGTIRIFTPGSEIPFRGLPTVGTAWLLREIGTPVEVLRPLAGDVTVRYEGEVALIRARAAWLPGAMHIVELDSAADVEAHPGQAMGEPWLFIWAWADKAARRLRARSFPTDYAILWLAREMPRFASQREEIGPARRNRMTAVASSQMTQASQANRAAPGMVFVSVP